MKVRGAAPACAVGAVLLAVFLPVGSVSAAAAPADEGCVKERLAALAAEEARDAGLNNLMAAESANDGAMKEYRGSLNRIDLSGGVPAGPAPRDLKRLSAAVDKTRKGVDAARGNLRAKIKALGDARAAYAECLKKPLPAQPAPSVQSPPAQPASSEQLASSEQPPSSEQPAAPPQPPSPVGGNSVAP
ncbi:hypothetical protein WEB32_11060 [Streptomyces netropsis]|uniref:hypothetical protein n=1 Tax=Streptomyces netropsis TaxID=55404 RepID=UPI0030D49DF5